MNRVADYKLSRAAGRVHHFARVFVEARASNEPLKIVAALSQECESHLDTLHPGDSLWLAALDGARYGAIAAGAPYGVEVAITRIQGICVDTISNTMWCAAAIAAWRAIPGSGDEPTPVYRDNRWHVILRTGETATTP